MKWFRQHAQMLERWAFLALLVSLPFQARIFLTGFGGGEWLSAWLWASDVFVVLLLLFWIARGVRLVDLVPVAFLILALPALVVHPTNVAMFSFLKLAEGLLLVAYIRTRRSWIIDALARPWVFFSILGGLLLNALAGIVQFGLQHDLGLAVLGESPLQPGIDGVANFVVAGGKIIRAYGFTPHPNILGVLIAAGLSVVVFLYVFRGMGGEQAVYSIRRQREELIRGAVLFVLVAALLLTFSRIAWLAAAVTLAFFLAILVFNKAMRRVYLFAALRFSLLLLSVTAIVVLSFWPFLSERVGTDVAAEQAGTLRTFYAQEAVVMISEHPVTGVGLGGYVAELAARNPGVPEWTLQPVHNVTLLLAAEMGWPMMALAISAFIVLIITAVRRFQKERDPSIALVEAMTLSLSGVLLVASLTDHLLWTSQQGSLLLWIVIGLLAQPKPRRI